MKASEEHLEFLMEKSQGGDKVAYEELLEFLIPIIKTFVIAKLRRNINDADDITQETLVAIHKARQTYIPGRPLYPWVFAIARYKLNDRYRALNRQEKLKSQIYKPDIQTSSTIEVDARDEITKILSLLSTHQREVLMRVKYEGYSIIEVARERDISESLVKVTIHRALKKLSGYIEE